MVYCVCCVFVNPRTGLGRPNLDCSARLRSPDFFDVLLAGKSSKEYGVSVLNKMKDLLPNHGAEAAKRLQLFVRAVDEKAHPVPEP